MVAAVSLVAGVVLVVLASASDDRSGLVVLAVMCWFLTGLFWYCARRMVLDSRK